MHPKYKNVLLQTTLITSFTIVKKKTLGLKIKGCFSVLKCPLYFGQSGSKVWAIKGVKSKNIMHQMLRCAISYNICKELYLRQ